MLNAEARQHNMLAEVLKKWDFFARAVPRLNIRGKEEMRTLIGGVVSICMFLILLGFALFKSD